MEHKQYNLPPREAQQPIVSPFELTAPNVNRTDKDLNIKNLHRVTDTETVINHGQKIKRTAVQGAVTTISASDYLICVTDLGVAPSIGLPKPSQVGVGKVYIIKDEAGGASNTTITIASVGEETIDGETSYTITDDYNSVNLYSNGSNWFIY